MIKYSIINHLLSFPVDDASGRYTNGFFYGNNYFMGSLSLCTSIFKDDTDISKLVNVCFAILCF